MQVALNQKHIQSIANVIRKKLTEASQNEITDLAQACFLSMRGKGIKKIDMNDFLVKQAVNLYCKAFYGYDDDSDMWKKRYEELTISMSLDGNYNTEEVVGNE